MDEQIQDKQDEKKIVVETNSLAIPAGSVVRLLEATQIEDLKTAEKSAYVINNITYMIIDGSFTKVVIGEDYNFIFDKRNGDFRRWGKDYTEDPLYSPIGPEILDLEISVDGCPNGCRFCYKNNTNKEATNMSFEDFTNIMDKVGPQLTQIAFGITGIQTHPDFMRMLEYCRHEKGIIPNFTLSGIDLTDDIAEQCAKLIGAVAVSAYQSDKNICYDTVKKFVDLGINQTNIHLMVSEETIDFVYEVLKDRRFDPRLADMNAIVFLGVKPKGRAEKGFSSLSTEKYQELIAYCFKYNIAVGFDSCSAPKFEAAVNNMGLKEDMVGKLLECSESCESSLFSSYINVDSEYWHCSFTENECNYTFVDVKGIDDFLKDVWYHPEVMKFRDGSIESMVDGCRHCQVFPSINP